ncbi:MAG: hypothetical protein R2715_15365 [Ilumatobacteraceae bacterium]
MTRPDPGARRWVDALAVPLLLAGLAVTPMLTSVRASASFVGSTSETSSVLAGALTGIHALKGHVHDDD